MTAFAMSTIAVMPNASQYTQLDQYLSKHVEDISKFISQSASVIFPLLQFDHLRDHPKIIAAVFDGILAAEDPLEIIKSLQKNRNADTKFLNELFQLALNDHQFDAADWISNPSRGSQDLLRLMSIDKRIIKKIELEIRNSTNRIHMLSKLIEYPHLYDSKSIRQSLSSMIDTLCTLLENKVTISQLIDKVLQTPPLIENQKIIESIKRGLKLWTKAHGDPKSFSEVVKSVKKYTKNSLLEQLMEPFSEYRDIDEIAFIER